MQTGVYPAEFGHEATQINVMTKSGGNVYHGALFDFLRNDVLDAVPYSFTANHANKQPFKWNDYGFEVDGPIRIPKIFNGKDRLFFMANYEWKRQRQNSQGIYSVPTAAMFGGDFSGLEHHDLRSEHRAQWGDQNAISQQCDPGRIGWTPSRLSF